MAETREADATYRQSLMSTPNTPSVAEVEPRGGVMDYLIQDGIVNIETKDRITSHVTRQDRCRALLDKLLASSNNRAFVVLHQALSEYYPWVVDGIGQQQYKEQDQKPQKVCRELDDIESNGQRQPTTDPRLNQQPKAQQNEKCPCRKVGEALSREMQQLTSRLEAAETRVKCLEEDLRASRRKESELERKLVESLKREETLRARVEQGAVMEQLLRVEIRQAIEDERLQLMQSASHELPVTLQSDKLPPRDGTGATLKLVERTAFCGLSSSAATAAAIYGITTLNNELYLARDRSNVINIHDIATLKQTRQLTLSHPSALRVPCPTDMTSCAATSSLYISDYANCRVHHVNPFSGEVIESWRVEGQAWGLSVTRQSTLIVCCRGAGRLCEFTSTGKLLREVVLPNTGSSGIDILHPLHAVAISGVEDIQYWVVCHGSQVVGNTEVNGQSRHHHSVCLIDKLGQVSHTRNLTSGLVTQPQHLAMTTDGNILVAGCANNCVQLFDGTNLQVIANVILPTGADAMCSLRPHRLCFCPSTSQVFVGLWDGQVLVYQLFK